MKFLRAFLITVATFAQQPAPEAKPDDKAAAPAPAKADDQAKPADQAAPPKADDKAASPAPSTDHWLTARFDFGYRWVEDARGNIPTYRPIVNLGSPPKLTRLEFAVTHPN